MTSLTALETLEETFGFRYPPLYKRLFAEGLLDVGTYGPDWLGTEFPKLRERPPLLLYKPDFELIQLADLEGVIAELLDPDRYRQVRAGLRFIPFAMNGAGDLYCFWPDARADGEPQVVFALHDVDEASIQARTLQDFMFRGLLEAVVEVAPDDLIATGSLKDNCRAMLATHGPFLNSSQKAHVAEVYGRELTDFSQPLPKGRQRRVQGLLSQEELERLLSSEIGLSSDDRSFSYMDE